MNLTTAEMVSIRLASQQLSGTKIQTASEMVGWFGAVQGQEYMQTKWSLGLRLSHTNDVSIEGELSDGSILRTHLLRPTWHLVTREDIYWLLDLTAPRVHAINMHMYRKTGLNEATFKKSRDIIINLLQGRKQLTRTEINLGFKRHNIDAEGHRLSYIMMQNELDGIICSGARKGNQFTYTLLEELVGKRKPIDHEEALNKLAQRFFFSRGPATVYDFATWSGLTLSNCKQGVELNKSKLSKLIFDGKEYFFNPQLTPGESKSLLMLLPLYDEYIMGYKDRSAILHYKNSLKHDIPMVFNNVMVWNGLIIGTWKRSIDPRQINIEIDQLNALTKVQSASLKSSILRFSAFYDREVTVNFRVR